jgi:hypothetical protein
MPAFRVRAKLNKLEVVATQMQLADAFYVGWPHFNESELGGERT